MNTKPIGSFSISQEFGNKFAEASGDFNPLHVDPVMARRYQFGSTVIHGIAGLLKALDLFVAQFDQPQYIDTINARFSKPIRYGDPVDVSYGKTKTGMTRLDVFSSQKRTQLIEVGFKDPSCKPAKLADNQNHEHLDRKACPELEFIAAKQLDDALELLWLSDLIAELFPNISQKIPDYQVAFLLGLTNIVGMRCPGLNSVFASFALSFKEQKGDFDYRLRYTITENDERFSRIIISLGHDLVQGDIEALFRPKPVQQPTFLEIKPLVKAKEFAVQRALVIGGTRGIGEITAKIIAAGGGNPVVSYASGKSDAERVVNDVCSGGGQCRSIHYDVLSPDEDIAICFDKYNITHIYYFASPLIEKSDKILWDNALFRKFCNFYLSGLANLLEVFVKNPEYRRNGIKVFIPSTIFLQEPIDGFGEYIAAKAAVEGFATQFNKKYPSWHLVTPRLPRVRTDQTSGIADNSLFRTVELMLNHISEMN